MAISWGVLVVLAIAAPWYILVSLQNPEYAGQFFIQKNLGIVRGYGQENL